MHTKNVRLSEGILIITINFGHLFLPNLTAQKLIQDCCHRIILLRILILYFLSWSKAAIIKYQVFLYFLIVVFYFGLIIEYAILTFGGVEYILFRFNFLSNYLLCFALNHLAIGGFYIFAFILCIYYIP